jgi:putative peptide zinc metalloprotease protein
MTESLFSSSWYRVAQIKPRLRNHAQIHRHLYRGKVWYVLQDHSSGRFHRFSPVANLVIGLMNGKRTLQEIWDVACNRLGDEAPTQDEVIRLISSLHSADVLQTDAAPDIGELHERKERQDRMRFKQYFRNPLSLRFPLLDPEPILERIAPFARFAFSWAGGLAWLAVVGWAAVLAGSHWSELTQNVTDQLFSAENLVLIGLVFPVAKLLHEFGHAAAVKAGGGEVHEMGVMFLVFMPIPYVEASAASAFRDKRHRMMVGAAGMMAELFVAALALFVWLNVAPGATRAVAYNVMLVAGISTLVFNANPLLRFDAYYILADYLEIPNLAQRSNSYLGYLVKRYLLGLRGQVPPEAGAGERAWFVLYAVSSFIYRIMIAVTISLMVAGKFFVIGVLIALWSLYLMMIQPVASKIAWFFAGSELGERRSRAVAAAALTAGVLAAIVFWVPAPAWTRTEGVAWAPEDTMVRAATDGFVTEIVAQPNRTVRKGEVLITRTDLELDSSVRLLSAQLAEQQARYTAALKNRVQSSMIEDEVAHLTERLATATKRAGELTILSPADGVFLMADAQDAPGRFVRRGELLGYVMDFSRVSVRVVIPQSDIDLVRKMTRRVELRAVERIPEVVAATLIRVVPAATDQLPSLALSSSGGGEISLSPNRGDSPGGEPKAAATLFVFDLELADKSAIRALGSRIYARFEREPEPLGTQWYRAARRVLLEKFNV